MGSSAGALAFDMIRARLESCPLQEKLGLLVPWAQRELVTNHQERPDAKFKKKKKEKAWKSAVNTAWIMVKVMQKRAHTSREMFKAHCVL